MTLASTPRRRLSRDQRARQLLDVAEQVFAERGSASTSMEELAERAGVTKPVIYDHFGSRDGLVAALVLRTGDDLSRLVFDAAAGESDPQLSLAAGLRAYFAFMRDHRAAWSFLQSDASVASATADASEQVRDRQADVIAELLRADIPGCTPARARFYAQVVIGAAERLAVGPRTAGSSVGSLTRHVMDVVWCGLAQVQDGRRWTPGTTSS